MTDSAVAAFREDIADIYGRLLNAKKPPKRFSREAAVQILSEDEDFVPDLGVEAIRLARRDRVDDVAANHVVNANLRLRGAPKQTPWLEILGSLAGGAGVQQVVTVMNDDEIGRSDVAWMVGLLLVTALLFGIRLVQRG
jgi:hypothetical protein